MRSKELPKVILYGNFSSLVRVPQSHLFMLIFTWMISVDNYEKKVAKKYKIIYHAIIYNVWRFEPGAERRRLWELEKGEVH